LLEALYAREFYTSACTLRLTGRIVDICKCTDRPRRKYYYQKRLPVSHSRAAWCFKETHTHTHTHTHTRTHTFAFSISLSEAFSNISSFSLFLSISLPPSFSCTHLHSLWLIIYPVSSDYPLTLADMYPRCISSDYRRFKNRLTRPQTQHRCVVSIIHSCVVTHSCQTENLSIKIVLDLLCNVSVCSVTLAALAQVFVYSMAHLSVNRHGRCNVWHQRAVPCGVATISRILKIIGLFCKRALWKRPDASSVKETYNFKEPTNRSNRIT